MTQRKIFNFESTVCQDETISKFGYSPDSLGKTSSKFIVAICRFCGNKMDIRKGFFNKAGSACHNECRLQEMSISGSPFSDSSVREKAKATNLARWGNECPQRSDVIRKKIGKTKQSKEYQDKITRVFHEKYGVSNPVHIDGHSEKVKQTSLKKYGVPHFNLDKTINDKRIMTNLNKYGHRNPAQSDYIKAKIAKSFQEHISENADSHQIISIVSADSFWTDLSSGKSINELSRIYGVDQKALNKILLSKKFRKKYRSLYSYPKAQKQNELISFLISIGIDDLVVNYRDLFDFEIDIYSPSLHLGIEFNGSYWHSEAVVAPPKSRNKHYEKTKSCNDSGIRLIQIFERDWDLRSTQIKNFIRSVFQKNTTNIHARECDLSFENASEFLDQNHIQGKPSNSLFWCNLVFDGKIVGSTCLSRHHRQSNNSYEIVLSRMAFKDSYNVRGGASRMLHHISRIARDNGYRTIITWSDNTLTNGDLYINLGFEFKKEYRPDYFYWDSKNNAYRSKQSCQKKKMNCPENITERDFCMKNGLYRIWDCGKKLFRKDI